MSATRLYVVLLVLFLVETDVLAQRKEPPPRETEGAEIIPNLGARLPLDRPFVNERGEKVRLGDYFGGEKPVLLILVYYRCASLCTLSLNGLVDVLREMDMEPGREFELVTLSIDPLDTPTFAKLKKQNYVKAYGRRAGHRGWHFLTGREPDIKALADAVGFGYREVERNGRREYIHQAGLFFVTPEGVLTRCVKDIKYDARTVRLSLVDASQGKQGTTIDSLISWCFHYDEDAGKYTLQAVSIMRIAGIATLLILGVILLPVWLRSRRR